MSRSSGRHFLQIPGPTNTPLSILAAIAKPTIDHRGPEFADLCLDVLKRIRSVFKTEGPVIIYPTSGTGAWEAALVNTLSPGDRVLMFETGWFSTLWSKMATALDLRPEIIPGDWRSGVRAEQIAEKLLADREHTYKAVAVVHNETSTGVKSNIEAVRRAIDDANHPALLLVDTISSLGSMDYRHDEWGVDVTICGSQKGLMLPPGLGFNAVSAKALEASKTARLTRSFLGWDDMLASNAQGFFPYTPSNQSFAGVEGRVGSDRGRRVDEYLHPARPRRTGNAAGSRAMGFRDPMPQRGGVFLFADRGPSPAKALGRRVTTPNPPRREPFARQRSRSARRSGVSHWSSRRFQ
jgi:alanine-glyoxylate transaminase/serine-glyoxylate transaminase/serine-pyruvate transaminase